MSDKKVGWLHIWWGDSGRGERLTRVAMALCKYCPDSGVVFLPIRGLDVQIMLRPGHATLPSSYLLNHGIRRTLKTKDFEGRAPPQAYFLSIRSLNVCRLCVSPQHKVSHIAHHILSDRSHVLYLPTRKRFQAILDGRYDQRQEGLWLEFIGNSLQKKRVVRSWATRRIHQAVTEALRMRGFDRNGRKLVDSDASKLKTSESNGSPVNLTTKHAPEALVGTVEVHILPNIVRTSYTEVQRQAGVMVDKILEICGGFPRNKRNISNRSHLAV